MSVDGGGEGGSPAGQADRIHGFAWANAA